MAIQHDIHGRKSHMLLPDAHCPTEGPPPHKPVWSRALPHERCNYHQQFPAVMTFAGTPLCQECTERFGFTTEDPGADS